MNTHQVSWPRNILLVCFPLFLSIYNFLAFANDDVIAVVEGKTITSQDVFVNKQAQHDIFVQKFHREPTDAEFSLAVFTAQKNRLISCMHNIIKEKVCGNLGITVTEEEVREKHRNVYPELKNNPQGALKNERRLFQNLVFALREALKHPGGEKEIYNVYLKDLMAYGTWQGSRRQFNTLAKIDLMEKAIPKTVEDLYKSADKSMKAWVINEKIDVILNKNMIVGDEEVKRHYDLKFKDNPNRPDFESVKAELRDELIVFNRAAWWREQYSKAQIVVKDKAYEEAISEFISGKNKPKVDTGKQ